MDVYCPLCLEPLDQDEFHYYAEESGQSVEAVRADFRARGCPAVRMACDPDAVHPDDEAQQKVAAIYDLLGDDMDAAACFFEDFGVVP